MMKKKLLFVFILSFCLPFMLTGCGPSLVSSGITTFEPNQNVANIKFKDYTNDIRIPRRVGVLFGGADTICVRATEIFTEGLMKLGFDVVQSKRIYEIINKEEIPSIYYGEKILTQRRFLLGVAKWYPLPPISEETSKKLLDKLSLEALFLGNVEAYYLKVRPGIFKDGKEGSYFPEDMSGKKWHTYLEIDLMLIPKGPYIWHCTTEDTHLFEKTWENSIASITKKALRRFERDIDVVKKKIVKQEKR